MSEGVWRYVRCGFALSCIAPLLPNGKIPGVLSMLGHHASLCNIGTTARRCASRSNRFRSTCRECTPRGTLQQSRYRSACEYRVDPSLASRRSSSPRCSRSSRTCSRTRARCRRREGLTLTVHVRVFSGSGSRGFENGRPNLLARRGRVVDRQGGGVPCAKPSGLALSIRMFPVRLLRRLSVAPGENRLQRCSYTEAPHSAASAIVACETSGPFAANSASGVVVRRWVRVPARFVPKRRELPAHRLADRTRSADLAAAFHARGCHDPARLAHFTTP